MEENLIKISELIPTTELKSADRIPIEQDGETRSIKGAVLEQKLLDKTDARYIENAQKGAPNGIAPLDDNGKVPNDNLNFGKVEEGNTGIVSGEEAYRVFKNVGINTSSEYTIIKREDFLYSLNKHLTAQNILMDSENHGVTDYIPIEGGSEYKWYGRLLYNRVCIEYDENKNPLGVIVNHTQDATVVTSEVFVTAENAKYIRCCSALVYNENDVNCYVQKINSEKVAILDRDNKLPNENLNFGTIKKNDKNVISGGETYDFFKNINVITEDEYVATREDYVQGSYLKINGDTYPENVSGVTDYIPIEGGSKYKWYGRVSFQRTCLEYDENKNIIRVIVNPTQNNIVYTEELIEASVNAKFFRLSSVLEREGLDIDCGLIKVGKINKVYEPIGRIDDSDSAVKSSVLLGKFNEINSIIKKNIPVPFKFRFWTPSFNIPTRQHGNYTGFIGEFDNAISNSIYSNLDIKKHTLGKDESGLYDLFSYNIKLKENKDLIPQKKILIISNVHGSELSNPYGVLDFFTNLLTNTEDVFNWLVMNFEFCIIPSANPWGFSNKIRSNSRGVNLNRNFPFGWKKQGIPSDWGDYSGEYPLSEKETIIVDNYIKNNINYIIGIDGHSFSGWADNPNTMFWINTFKKNVFTWHDTAVCVTKYTNELFNIINDNNTYARLVDVDSTELNGNGQLSAYLNFINPESTSFLLETAMRRFENTNDDGTENMNKICLSVYVNVIINALRSF